MIEVPRADWQDLDAVLPDERPCALVPSHVVATGAGRIWVDDPNEPRALAVVSGGNLALCGGSSAVQIGAVERLIDELLEQWERVFIDAGEGFEQRLRDEVKELWGWPRVQLEASGPTPAAPEVADDFAMRRLGADDTAAIGRLGLDIIWISDTHGGADALAASGLGFAVWRGDQIVSLAASFFVGKRFEELGVVTESEYRGRGLSTACAAALIDDIRGRWRMPCWGTTPDNDASLRVARKLGFRRLDDAMHFGAGHKLTGSLPLD